MYTHVPEIFLVIGALLGTQNGREFEIVNTFELCLDDDTSGRIDHGFVVSRKDQCECRMGTLPSAIAMLTSCADKQVFPSLELIGWYTVAQEVSAQHLTLHEQVGQAKHCHCYHFLF